MKEAIIFNKPIQIASGGIEGPKYRVTHGGESLLIKTIELRGHDGLVRQAYEAVDNYDHRHPKYVPPAIDRTLAHVAIFDAIKPGFDQWVWQTTPETAYAVNLTINRPQYFALPRTIYDPAATSQRHMYFEGSETIPTPLTPEEYARIYGKYQTTKFDSGYMRAGVAVPWIENFEDKKLKNQIRNGAASPLIAVTALLRAAQWNRYLQDNGMYWSDQIDGKDDSYLLTGTAQEGYSLVIHDFDFHVTDMSALDNFSIGSDTVLYKVRAKDINYGPKKRGFRDEFWPTLLQYQGVGDTTYNGLIIALSHLQKTSADPLSLDESLHVLSWIQRELAPYADRPEEQARILTSLVPPSLDSRNVPGILARAEASQGVSPKGDVLYKASPAESPSHPELITLYAQTEATIAAKEEELRLLREEHARIGRILGKSPNTT